MPTSLSDPLVIQTLQAKPSTFQTNAGTKIPYPYPSPEDWRDLWIYFLLVDRFNNPVNPPSPNTYPCLQYQGGNFSGIRQQLPYLKKLGAGAIWISPVLMNPQWFNWYWGGYGTLDYLRIEPRFCDNPAQALQDPSVADQEFRALVDEAHANGMYVILDIVLNHAGDLFAYASIGDEAPWNDNKEYNIDWRDGQGTAINDWTEVEDIPNLPREGAVWPKEFQENKYFRRKGGNGTQGDFSKLKELATDYCEDSIFPVRNHLITAYQYLIAKFDVDGFRIDTLQYIEADFARVFGNAMREYALSIGKKNFFTFGEVWQDDDEERIAEFIGRNTQKDDEFIGVDAAIDFPMRKRLVSVCKGFEPPSSLADHYNNRLTILRTIVSSHGDAGKNYVTFLDNHDLNSRFHNKNFPAQTKLALTCLMCLQGIPCIYYGNEQGLDGSGNTREYVREALWSFPNAFSDQHELYRFIQDLTTLRDSEPTLRYGRQYFRMCSGNGVDFDYSRFNGGIIAFSRLLNYTEVMVVANTNTQENVDVHVIVDKNLNAEGKSWQVVFPTDRMGIYPKQCSTHGPYRTIEINLKAMEFMVLC